MNVYLYIILKKDIYGPTYISNTDKSIGNVILSQSSSSVQNTKSIKHVQITIMSFKSVIMNWFAMILELLRVSTLLNC